MPTFSPLEAQRDSLQQLRPALEPSGHAWQSSEPAGGVNPPSAAGGPGSLQCLGLCGSHSPRTRWVEFCSSRGAAGRDRGAGVAPLGHLGQESPLLTSARPLECPCRSPATTPGRSSPAELRTPFLKSGEALDRPAEHQPGPTAPPTPGMALPLATTGREEEEIVKPRASGAGLAVT